MAIADYLHSHGIPATFFLIGELVDRCPSDDLQRLLQQGHLIGNHTYSHPRGAYDSAEELMKTRNALLRRLPQEVVAHLLFRAPYGVWSRHHAAAANMCQEVKDSTCGPIHWDIDTRDWRFWRDARTEIDSGALAECVSATFEAIEHKQEGIVLLHCNIWESSTRAKSQGSGLVKALIPRLRCAGYSFVRLDQLTSVKRACAVLRQWFVRMASSPFYLADEVNSWHLLSAVNASCPDPFIFDEIPCSDGELALVSSSGRYFVGRRTDGIVTVVDHASNSRERQRLESDFGLRNGDSETHSPGGISADTMSVPTEERPGHQAVHVGAQFRLEPVDL
jgi:peptidoglycan/xylan/chitin deacetylase (PgdA/CDA1 family)